MQTKYLLLFIIALTSVLGTEDAADVIASRFMFKADTDRRVMIDTTFKTNPTQVFQLCYGLKRQKLYDLILSYFHPNIANIVLYGSYDFYIQYGNAVSFSGMEAKSTITGNNIATGYYLSSHRYYDQDKRSEISTYVNIHSFGWTAKKWNIIPVASSYVGTAFYISLAQDELQYDGVNQQGWFLSAQRLVAFDKLSSIGTNLILIAPPTQANVWVLYPVDRGERFIISLAYDDYQFDGVNQQGWAMDYFVGEGPAAASQIRSNDPTNFDVSAYVSILEKFGGANYNSWEITFAGS